MKILLNILSFTLLTFVVHGQKTIQTKQIELTYTNGYEIFSICTAGCTVNYDDLKEYFWHTEFSRIKSTKGGSGGSMLHGNYKFYDEQGNLRQDKNYYLGIIDGNEKNWDSLGNIISQSKYKMGTRVYAKFKDEENYWIEFIGPILEEGSIKKIYNQHNLLISENTMLANSKEQIRTYYEYSGKLKEEYSMGGFGGLFMTGKYTVYYENGNIEIEGQFYDGEFTNIRVGTWNWYKSDGTLETSEQYKANIEKWSNGEDKVLGCYILDTNTNTWLKTDEWRWYSEDGTFLSSKNYVWGVETSE